MYVSIALRISDDSVCSVCVWRLVIWCPGIEVADFLREFQMGQYVASFRANAVTGSTLLSLNSVELRKTLGVTKLRDRRMIMDAIVYLKETQDSRRTLPEDGRILTHLSNEVTVLSWLRFGANLLLVSIANLRLLDLSSGSNKRAVVALSFIVCCLAAGSMLYAFNRYYWMHQMIESPGLDFEPDDVRLLTPGLLAPTLIVILAYALMANDTEEAALLLLASA